MAEDEKIGSIPYQRTKGFDPLVDKDRPLSMKKIPGYRAPVEKKPGRKDDEREPDRLGTGRTKGETRATSRKATRARSGR